MTSKPLKSRDDYVNAILDSSSHKKLIVAGPGTGKTYLFKKALKKAGGAGLALTFINNLAADLKVALSDLADAHTFHGYCKALLLKKRIMGSESPVYFPALTGILASDISILKDKSWDEEKLSSQFGNMDDSNGYLSLALELGSYYEAVGHTDCVYRVWKWLKHDENRIPGFPLIVVDEFQDFNALEADLISRLSTRSAVLVAGDDDQALYGFKGASAEFIRHLAGSDTHELFELPYCSRCTKVIVEAVNTVVTKAIKLGCLKGRLTKHYAPHSDKDSDSKEYPQIFHATVSVETKPCPYLGKFVEWLSKSIGTSDTEGAKKGGYPALLVIGPSYLVERAYVYLRKTRDDLVYLKSPRRELSILDGYRLLMNNKNSNLGWRVVLETRPCNGTKELLVECLTQFKELGSAVPANYRKRHLTRASIFGEALREETHSKENLTALATTLKVKLIELLQAGMKCDEAIEGIDELDLVSPEPPELAGKTVFTTIVGSKGLSAAHVCVLGINEGHLPKNNASPTDAEVCQFLVALSRTRKSCCLVSVNRFGAEPLSPSLFGDWVRELTNRFYVDKKFLESKPT